MMLTEAEVVDVLHDDHFVVVLDEERVIEHVLHVRVVPGRQIAERLLDTFWCARESLALGILTELLEELLDKLRDHTASLAHPPCWSLAVSWTVTRQSAGVSLALWVITRADSAAADISRWSIRSNRTSATVRSGPARSGARPVPASGDPISVIVVLQVWPCDGSHCASARLISSQLSLGLSSRGPAPKPWVCVSSTVGRITRD